MSQRMPDYEDLRARQARAQESIVTAPDELDLTVSVWCPNCQHTHVPNIPRFTWACKECGFGSWDIGTATRHASMRPTHHVFQEEHPVVPMKEKP